MTATVQGSSARARRSPKASTDVSDVSTWARAHGRGLLFVDDNYFLLEMTARVFRRVGVTCRTASTHADAVEVVAEDENIHTVILDFEMPEGDVADLVRRLRDIRPDVVLVGSSGTDHRLDFAERGVDRYVAKPWGLSELLHAAGTEARRGF